MVLGERSELLGRGLKPNARTNRTEWVDVQGAPADDNRSAGLGEKESGRVQHADGNRPATMEERRQSATAMEAQRQPRLAARREANRQRAAARRQLRREKQAAAVDALQQQVD